MPVITEQAHQQQQRLILKSNAKIREKQAEIYKEPVKVRSPIRKERFETSPPAIFEGNLSKQKSKFSEEYSKRVNVKKEDGISQATQQTIAMAEHSRIIAYSKQQGYASESMTERWLTK